MCYGMRTWYPLTQNVTKVHTNDSTRNPVHPRVNKSSQCNRVNKSSQCNLEAQTSCDKRNVNRLGVSVQTFLFPELVERRMILLATAPAVRGYHVLLSM